MSAGNTNSNIKTAGKWSGLRQSIVRAKPNANHAAEQAAGFEGGL